MSAESKTPHFSLLMASLNVPMRVVSFGTSKSVEHRLASMGIGVGTVIQIMQQNSEGIIVAVGNTRIAIAPGIAHKVIVTPTLPSH